jgi:hypothetical protein
MSKYLKYGISGLALAVGLGAASAQTFAQQDRREDSRMERPDRGQAGSADRSSREDQGQNDEQREKKLGQSDKGDAKTGQSNQDEQDQSDEQRKKRVGQSDERRDMNKGENRGERARSDDRDSAKSADRERGDRADRDRSKRAEGSKKNRERIKLTQKNRVVIRERVIERAPKKYRRNEINFNISVGRQIPRDFRIYSLPPVFIEIAPDYEGYDYIVVGDSVLIIDPETREIVDIVEI